MTKYQQFLADLQTFVSSLRAYLFTMHQLPPTPAPIEQPPTPPISPVAPLPAPKYLWDTRENTRHSLRVICDEEGLTLEQKDLVSQVLHCESDYNITTVHPNIVTKTLPDGTKHTYTASTDYGLCQWNDFYHGKEISPDEALHNPEKAMRLMCQYVKAGELKDWVCYSEGLYKNYSS